ncbi:unnamed protein product [Linum tenue]|uniref:Fe2OG dioxygenase domain-containing protein n=1 Tax=Linum tenue TaxID=586396 RepID=A0AAV0LT16_9ROSI|nr:unnamed protein product [Linum tenue]
MEPAKSVSLGSSLLVPSVQDLIKTQLGVVPSRYLRPDQDQPIVFDADVPIVDLEKLIDEATMDSELAVLHSACKDWGFFQLVNHGVSPALLENMNQPPDLRKPHLLPKLPLPFRDTLENYSLEVRNLAAKVLDQMAKALKMKPEEMKDIFSGNIRQAMRTNYYPPCPEPDKVIGLTPHSDSTGLTILLQVNEVEGLQIKKDGSWVPVKVLPNAFVVNVGDIVEIITNGVYRSIEHRATVNSEKERLSIASFHSPRFDGEIYPAPSLVTGESPALFRNVSVKEYLKGLFSRELQGKSYLDTLRI